MSESKAIKNIIKESPLFILGATASGKTRLAVRLAQEFDAEIISADSRQVYRGLDIGTGKDLQIYAEAGVRNHLLDVVDPNTEFNLFAYRQEFSRAYADIERRGKNIIVAGGSGLYISALLEGYCLAPVPVNEGLRRELEKLSQEQLNERLRLLKPKLHNNTDTSNRARTIRAIEIALAEPKNKAESPLFTTKPLLIGLDWQMDTLRERIAARLQKRREEGLLAEMASLHANGVSWERLEALGLEYRYVSYFLKGELSETEMLAVLEIRIGQFAKRQMSWLRRLERNGQKICWIKGDDYAQALSVALAQWR